MSPTPHSALFLSGAVGGGRDKAQSRTRNRDDLKTNGPSNKEAVAEEETRKVCSGSGERDSWQVGSRQGRGRG